MSGSQGADYLGLSRSPQELSQASDIDNGEEEVSSSLEGRVSPNENIHWVTAELYFAPEPSGMSFFNFRIN